MLIHDGAVLSSNRLQELICVARLASRKRHGFASSTEEADVFNFLRNDEAVTKADAALLGIEATYQQAAKPLIEALRALDRKKIDAVQKLADAIALDAESE